MNKQPTVARAPRAETETFIVAKTDEGYRIFSPHAPASQYLVCDTGDDMTCTCPEFAANSGDPDWCCKHIKAVHQYLDGQNHRRPPDSGATGAVPANDAPPNDPPPKKSASRNAESSMLIKRSLSPDGRIDSLSVEFTIPVGKISSDEIKEHAARAMRLQKEIMHGFVKATGNGPVERNGAHGGEARGAKPAQLLNIDAMETRKGHSLFINVFVEKEMAKLFGDEETLIAALASAGYPNWPEQLAEGTELNLPCRAITKRNGKYLNIERLLPASARIGNGG